jgi:hypothetical protein
MTNTGKCKITSSVDAPCFGSIHGVFRLLDCLHEGVEKVEVVCVRCQRVDESREQPVNTGLRRTPRQAGDEDTLLELGEYGHIVVVPQGMMGEHVDEERKRVLREQSKAATYKQVRLMHE